MLAKTIIYAIIGEPIGGIIMLSIEILIEINKLDSNKKQVLDRYLIGQKSGSYDFAKSENELKRLIMVLDKMHDELVNELVDSDFTVIALEDTIIPNEEIVEIKTNIPECLKNEEFEVIFKGISSLGCLKMYSQKTEDGIKVFAENTVPEEVYDKYDLCVSSFSNPNSPDYVEAGLYQIKKDQVLGVAVRNVTQSLPEKEKQYTR